MVDLPEVTGKYQVNLQILRSAHEAARDLLTETKGDTLRVLNEYHHDLAETNGEKIQRLRTDRGG